MGQEGLDLKRLGQNGYTVNLVVFAQQQVIRFSCQVPLMNGLKLNHAMEVLEGAESDLIADVKAVMAGLKKLKADPQVGGGPQGETVLALAPRSLVEMSLTDAGLAGSAVLSALMTYDGEEPGVNEAVIKYVVACGGGVL